MSFVSIIIPNYNNAKHLPKCIDSCIWQGKEYLKEIIVVDDFSTDDSLAVLGKLDKKYPNLIKIIKNTQKGANNARNLGFSFSSGEYIQWLDSDDVLKSGKLRTQVDFLSTHFLYEFVYSDWQNNYYKDGIYEREEVMLSKVYEDYLLELLKDNWQPCHSYLMRRNIAEKIHRKGGWNSKTIVDQDREYFTFCAIEGGRFFYVPGTFCIYNRWQDTGSTSGIDFKERLKLNIPLLYSFKDNINASSEIKDEMKKVYNKIINTELLVSAYYNSEIEFREKIAQSSIKWSRVHWKMRMVLPFLLMKKNGRVSKRLKQLAKKAENPAIAKAEG